MFPYWFLFSIFAVGSLGNAQPKSGRYADLSPLLLVAGLFAALFVGMRFETGADWSNYIDIFKATASQLSSALASGDPAYMFFNWLIRQAGGQLWHVNLICSLIFMWGLIRFAQTQPNPWLALAVAIPYLVIVVSMSYTRQAVAIGFLMVAIRAFERGRLQLFLGYLIAAALFHKTAIVVLPLFVLAVTKHRTVIWLAAGLIGVVLFTFLLSAVLDRMTDIYFGSELESSGAMVRVLMNVVPAVIFASISRRLCRSETELLLWRNFAFAALATFGALFVFSSTTLVDRVALYLIPLQVFVLSRLPYAFPMNGRANSQLLLGVLVYSAAVQLVWLTYAKHATLWIPYRFALMATGN